MLTQIISILSRMPMKTESRQNNQNELGYYDATNTHGKHKASQQKIPKDNYKKAIFLVFLNLIENM